MLADRRTDATTLSMSCRRLAHAAGHPPGDDALLTHSSEQPLTLAVDDPARGMRNDYRPRRTGGAEPDVFDGYCDIVLDANVRRGAGGAAQHQHPRPGRAVDQCRERARVRSEKGVRWEPTAPIAA